MGFTFPPDKEGIQKEYLNERGGGGVITCKKSFSDSKYFYMPSLNWSNPKHTSHLECVLILEILKEKSSLKFSHIASSSQTNKHSLTLGTMSRIIKMTFLIQGKFLFSLFGPKSVLNIL